MRLDPSDIPVLPRGVRLKHCEIRGAWFLLGPERALKLNPVARAVLMEVDGAQDFSFIINRLDLRFDVGSEQIAADVGAFLEDLIARRLVDLR
ncbi:MAG: pyrroloquinoline quinone biosynthesis peptide chaperone PqqD [Pseudomonadota bacterium]